MRSDVRSLSTPILVCVGVIVILLTVGIVDRIVSDHDWLFIVAELVHTIGIVILLYKVQVKNTCAGISRKSQELFAIFLGVRLYCSLVMEKDVHTVIDLFTLAATGFVLFSLSIKHRQSYSAEHDSFNNLYIIVPAAILALAVHPGTNHVLLNRLLWAFCVYIEAVAVLPQLLMMQKMKEVEALTANYVFALGVSRFISCLHWIIFMYRFGITDFIASPSQKREASPLWMLLVLLSEIVQTGILADFCYLYILSARRGETLMRLPV